jgi:glucosamine--fructose-6-phosphate aminotransferase (isomerizing)
VSYTLDEIVRIPGMLENLKNLKFNFSKDTRYLFVGCGSSYNLGFIMKTLLNLNGYKADVVTSGHVMLFNKVPKSDIAILITRTGETTETIKAAQIIKKTGIKSVGITCTKDSTISNICDDSIVLDFAEEKSVVMTGSFVLILAMFVNSIKYHDFSEESEKVLNLSNKVINSIDLSKYEHFVFLGYDENLGVSKEGALKLQEMALQYVEYHEPLEYRHGPISRLSEKTLVVINSKDTPEEKKLKIDIEKLGASTLEISFEGDIKVPSLNGFEVPLRLIPIQYLGYKKAIQMGYNPDSPKNLSKSVKLE